MALTWTTRTNKIKMLMCALALVLIVCLCFAETGKAYTCTVAATSVSTAGGYISFRIGNLSRGFSSVSCAVWCDAGGQDDLRWYDISYNMKWNGYDYVTAYISNHGYQVGTYHCHVWDETPYYF